MLEQQKMLYDSKLEQLDQLHQQKQVSLVRNGQSCQKQVSLVSEFTCTCLSSAHEP